MNVKDKVIALTGAGSGIGRALAVNLAQQGGHLALADWNEISLMETAESLKKHPVKISTHVIDVSKREQTEKFATDVVAYHDGVDIVINNAGVTVVETLEDTTHEDFEWIMGVNFWGVVHGTRAFIPYLKKRPESRIVNVSSIAARVGLPVQGAYCATKSAVRSFSDVLRMELFSEGVSVTCVEPGGVKTNIVRNARFYKNPININEAPDKFAYADKFDNELAVSTAEQAARKIVRGINRGKNSVMIGWDASFLYQFNRFLPGLYPRIIKYYYNNKK